MIIPHRKVVSNMLGMLTTNQYGGMTVVLSTAQLCFNRIPQSHNVVLVSSTSQNTFFFCITAVLFNKFLIISNAVDHCFAKGGLLLPRLCSDSGLMPYALKSKSSDSTTVELRTTKPDSEVTELSMWSTFCILSKKRLSSSNIQWIGLRENLQETIDFPIKYGAFL